jgi:hypothetical protein
MNPPAPRGGLLARLARALHRIVHPQHLEERARIERLTALVTSSAAHHAKRLEKLGKRLDAVAGQLARAATAADVAAVSRDVERLSPQVDALREETRMRVRSLSQAVKASERTRELQDDETRVLRRLTRLAASDRPVLVGPWSGEVGFELLYWIPFVTWALQRARVNPERLIVMSRGGPASWYAHLGGRYVDALSYVSPGEFRAGTEAHKKQRNPGAFDRLLVRRAIAASGAGRPILLHPGLMYRVFYPYWKQAATMRRVTKFTQHRRVVAPAAPEALAARLPREYVAVRFYFNASFPDTADNRAFIAATIAGLAASTEVVVLNTPFQVDDHSDAAFTRSPRVHFVDDLMLPESNLELQTAVIGGAKAFVGTYGGYAYLAPLCGVPSLAFFSVRDAFFAHHLELAEQVFRSLGAGSLVPIDVRDAALIQATLAPPRP